MLVASHVHGAGVYDQDLASVESQTRPASQEAWVRRGHSAFAHSLMGSRAQRTACKVSMRHDEDVGAFRVYVTLSPLELVHESFVDLFNLCDQFVTAG